MPEGPVKYRARLLKLLGLTETADEHIPHFTVYNVLPDQEEQAQSFGWADTAASSSSRDVPGHSGFPTNHRQPMIMNPDFPDQEQPAIEDLNQPLAVRQIVEEIRYNNATLKDDFEKKVTFDSCTIPIINSVK